MNLKTFSIYTRIFIFFLFIVLRLNGQKFDSLLNILETQYPQERIYVHYDKSYYNPGETIWFKAYLFSGYLPSGISTTMYAELITDKGKMLDRKIMPVLGATATSGFDLPDSLKSSLIYIRVYTSWMLNFDSSFIYLKPIRIIIPAKIVKPKKEPSYLLNFFPEGGDMVAGIESRVAFKATDEEGFPVKIKGDIVNSKGQKIVSFSDMHDGMGYFFFTPIAGEKYNAIWKNSKGGMEETIIPAVKERGVLLSVNNTSNNVSYTLHRSADVPANYKTIHVVAQMQQQPVYIARVNLTGKEAVTTSINVDSIPDGIMQVTIFTEDMFPIAERIVFINQNNYYFTTDLHATQKNITKKGKNILQIDVGDTLLTNLSISVTDAGINPADKEEENIFSHLLLTSDIKGFVYNPAYYFSNNSDSVQSHLDLVMMTNGWRRFKWEDVIAGNWPVIKKYPQPYLTVTGNVFGLSQYQLANGQELSVILKTQKNSQILVTPVNKKGQFIIKDMLFFDTARLFYQFNNDKDKRLTSTATIDFKNSFLIVADNPLTDLKPFLKPITPDTVVQKKNAILNKLREEEFFEGIKVKELEVVKVTAHTKSAVQKMNEEYTSGFFSGSDGRVFDVADDRFANSSISVLDYLQGKIAGLQINTSEGVSGGSVSWRGSTTSLFLNEMTADASMVQSTSMSDVAMIKVFNPPFFGAAGGGAGGAVAVYTKKGYQLGNSVKGLDFVSIRGYTPLKEFYSPDYSADADINKNDYRTTLYWNPHLIFDKSKRRISIPFYNSDNCKKIRVVIEGMNEDGKLTREEKLFE